MTTFAAAKVLLFLESGKILLTSVKLKKHNSSSHNLFQRLYARKP